MAFTWTGNPAASTIEQIRWEINDTDSANPKFQDHEIQYAYDQEHTILKAAARLCEQLASKYADDVDRSLGPLRLSLGKKVDAYRQKARDLRRRAAAYATPYAGGISKADELVFENDSDLNQPNFEIGMMDNV